MSKILFKNDETIKIHINEVNKVGKQIAISVGDRTIHLEIIGNKFPLKSEINRLDNEDENNQIDLKPPLPTEKLADKLEEKGVTMSKEERDNASKLLNEINYYRLSIYVLFLDPSNRSYTRLMEIYDFDRFLRNSISSLLNPIEELLRTTLANYFSCKAFADGKSSQEAALIYLDRDIFNLKKHKSQDIDQQITGYRSIRKFLL